VKVGSIVIDCNDFETMTAFWSEALHYRANREPEGGFVVLRDPEGNNVNVSLQEVPERATEKNRLHFDLYSTDQAGEVERLLGIGATLRPRLREHGDDFVVLADPEGNLFCVIDVS
jgi:catechol 2,3-dioxygenase-like lactoylglutathione lyase family enzyme